MINLNINFPLYHSFLVTVQMHTKRGRMVHPFLCICFGQHLYFPSFFQRLIIQCLVSYFVSWQDEVQDTIYGISFLYFVHLSILLPSHPVGNVFPENWWRRDVWHICKMRIWHWAKIRRKCFSIFPTCEGIFQAFDGLALKLESICICFCKSSNVQCIWQLN